MVDDCVKRGKSVQEGGAVYNFTGPQGFGIANMADSLYAIKKLVFDEKKVTLAEYKRALAMNYGQGFDAVSAGEIVTEILREMNRNGMAVDEAQIAGMIQTVMNTELPAEEKKRYEALRAMIDEVPKFGNDNEEVDMFARDVAYTYTKPLLNYRNPRGGQFQAG